MKQVFFYTTSGCHLCELAQSLIDPLAKELALEVQEVEISEDDRLVDLYGVRIPVVATDNDQDGLGWPFDEFTLRRYLTRNPSH